jgi:hypothetical protein
VTGKIINPPAPLAAPAVAPPPPPVMGQQSVSPPAEGFLDKYGKHLAIGGGVLLLIVLVVSLGKR